MANLTRAEMIDRVLEHLGVKPAEQSASAADVKAVGEVLDSCHARLRAENRALFETQSVPPDAQIPFRDVVALDCSTLFGVGAERMQLLVMGEQKARRELAKIVRSRHEVADAVVVDY
jgi:hypothetical protein